MIRQVEARIQGLAADLAKIKKYVQVVEEENTRLKEELARITLSRPPAAPEGPGEPAARGIDCLVDLYDRGFHICNLYFGGIRSGDCLFCASFIQRGRR
jgi:regulator of replication initiation timing